MSDGAYSNVVGLAVQRVTLVTLGSNNAFTSLEDQAKNFALRVTTTRKTEARKASTA